jgi:trk system potassium uptake protein TrkA
MRAVIIGAGRMAVEACRILLHRGHQVVVVEKERERIDELRDVLDCSFLHGDGSKPDLLKEAGPGEADILFCLTGSDPANIIASLVGRSLGYDKVVTRIQDTSYEPICLELGLDDTIIPSRTIGRYLADMAEGIDVLELHTVLRGDARFFTLIAGKEEEGPVEDLPLPEAARVVCLYREDEFTMADAGTRVKAGDEVVVLTDAQHLAELRERWEPPESGDDGE